MYVIDVRNVNQALSRGLRLLDDPEEYDSEGSRNGPVRVAREPVTTVTRKPLERVLFSPLRNANPFFHLFESLWMLAGRNDLPWLAQFNKQMATYSDDGGKTQPAAYGFRWREHFGYDQIDEVVEALTSNPSSRRCVLAMWDPWGIHQTADGEFAFRGDLLSAGASKDVPCNTHCYFRVRNGALHMTVCCRSNDIWWGAHGANAVHFSVLLEYIAARCGFEVGSMTQISNNYHVYTDVVGGLTQRAQDALNTDYYTRGITQGLVGVTPMFHHNDMGLFGTDLPKFMEYAGSPYVVPSQRGRREADRPKLQHPFLRDVAVPMLRAWDMHKCADYNSALGFCFQVGALNSDWQRACVDWMARRRDNYMGGE